MSTQTVTLKQLAAKVRLLQDGVAHLDWDKQSEWQRNANSYRLKLVYKGRSYSFDFWQGIGISHDPETEGVLDCLLSDANSGETFEYFCSELGYDPDSRKAERLWKQCQQVEKRMRRLLGDEYETFLYADRS